MLQPRSLLWLIVSAFVIACLSFIPQVRAAVMVPALFVNIAVQDGAWRPLDLFTPTPLRESLQIRSSSGRILDVDFYVPHGAKKEAALMIYAPHAGGGQEDARLVNIAESLARSGFVVAVPFYDAYDGILSQRDVEDVVSSFETLLKHVHVDQNRAGLLAISYGNGPALLAAADSRIADSVDFVVSYAGYYDLRSAVRYVITGEYAYDDTREYLEPEPWVRDIARKNLSAFGLNEQEIGDLFAHPETFEEQMAAYPNLQRSMDDLSPKQVIDRIETAVLISHSTGDRTIPYTESLRLHDAVKNRLPSTLAIVNMFVHGETIPITPKSVWQNFLPSFVSGYTILFNLLSQQWNP